MGDARASRNPMLLSRLSGALSLRQAARAWVWLLFQAPPRTTRWAVTGNPAGKAGPRIVSYRRCGLQKIRAQRAALSGVTPTLHRVTLEYDEPRT